MAKKKISNMVFDKSEPNGADSGQVNKEEKQIFYRLASPLSAKIEGHTGKVSVVLIFAIVWTMGLIGITVANLVTGEKFETGAIIVISMFAVVSAALLAFGIIHQKRRLAANAEERALLNDCLCTDGIVERCDCVEHRTHDRDGSDSYRYEVTLVYTYTNLQRKTATGIHKSTYRYDPEFYKGQYLMVAFNDKGDSRILNGFTLKKEDEEAFLKNEAERSDDDFDGLDGKLIRHNENKIKSAELPYIWLWASVGIFVFVAIYTVPISIFAVPQLASSHLVPATIGIVMIYLMPAVLTGAIAYMLSRFFRGTNKIKSILKNEPKFTRGKIFASEKTYRGGSKQVLYCYINADGEKITEVLRSPYHRKTVQGNARFVTVVYDKNGRSVPLH